MKKDKTIPACVVVDCMNNKNNFINLTAKKKKISIIYDQNPFDARFQIFFCVYGLHFRFNSA